MYTIEFETDVKNEYIKIPNYKKFMHKRVKVVLMSQQDEPKKTYSFDDLIGKLEWDGDAVSEQRNIRDEW